MYYLVTYMLNEIIISEVVKRFIKISTDCLSDLFEQSNKSEYIQVRLSNHLTYVANWSQNVQIPGMGDSIDTDNETVKLNLHIEPRRFRSKEGTLVDESFLLNDNRHYLILGDPGSGKTTTLKRFARNLFLNPPTDLSDKNQYPILIVLREYDTNINLNCYIAETIGLNYETIQEMEPATNRIKRTRYMVGNEQLQYLLPKILDLTGAVLLFDGLDELDYNIRAELSSQINQLALRLGQSKVILTARYSALEIELEGIKNLEIASLDKDQIRKISTFWLDNPNNFIENLQKVPYHDLIDRPLLLTQLLFLFKFEGELPKRPNVIYKKIIRLLLQEWDKARGIMRRSKYSQFDPDTKQEFLSTLAYELTYKTRTVVFSDEDLRQIYEKICTRFDLPVNEANEVAAEIETHTGIIQSAAKQQFEFSHLSLQEFLCASHIVREPLGGQIGKYVRERSAPLAVAVALSAEPSSWLANLLLRYGNPDYFDATTLKDFIYRLLIEKPYLRENTALGYAIIKLHFSYCDNFELLKDSLEQLCQETSVGRSLGLSLGTYWVVKNKNVEGKYFYLIRKHETSDQTLGRDYSFPKPAEGRFPWDVFLKTVRRYNVRVWWCKNEFEDVGRQFTIKDEKPIYDMYE